MAQPQNTRQDPDLPSVLADTPNDIPLDPAASSHLQGLNAGLTLTSVHDSAVGWYTLFTPAAAYAFTPHFAVDLTMPIYLYRLAEDRTTTPQGGPGQPPEPDNASQLSPHTWDPGDLVVAAHAIFPGPRLGYTLTPSLTLPSGDTEDGLSTGRVTFDINNHLETRLSRSTLILDLGGGDSSNLFNGLVTRDYTALGALANFQIGLRRPLFRRAIFQSVVYEQLPLTGGKVYTTVTRPGGPPRTVVASSTAIEDNGFVNFLTIPVAPHLAFQGFYNRSLRQHTDSVGIGLSFTLRDPRTLLRPRDQRTRNYYDRLLSP
jgi:hypothetical protein